MRQLLPTPSLPMEMTFIRVACFAGGSAGGFLRSATAIAVRTLRKRGWEGLNHQAEKSQFLLMMMMM